MSEEEKHAIEFFNKVIYQIGEEDIMKNNCILLNLIDRLQKENNIKDKVIDNLYADIEYEYSGTNYLKSLDEYYEEAQDE